MPKMKYYTLILFFALCKIYSPVQAVICALNLWENEKKSVFVIGDNHCYFETNMSAQHIQADKDHKEQLLQAINRTASQQKKYAFLVEGSSSITEQEHEYFLMAKKYPALIYTGTYVYLPMFAQEKNYQHGSITFIPFDRRSPVIRTPVQFLLNLYDAIEMVSDNQYTMDSLIRDASAEKNFLTKFDTQIIKTFILKTLQQTTIDEYLCNLHTVTEQLKDIKEYKKITALIAQAKKTFDNITTSTTIGDFFWQIIEKKGLKNFREETTWIYDLNHILGNVSLKLALKQALDKFENIVIFTGQSHIFKANHLLANHGFTLKIAEGNQKKINTQQPDYHTCNSNMIKTFLDRITEKTQSSIPSQSCATCGKNSIKKCAQCKKVFYCSTDCQRADWEKHKIGCRA